MLATLVGSVFGGLAGPAATSPPKVVTDLIVEYMPNVLDEQNFKLLTGCPEHSGDKVSMFKLPHT